MAVFYFRTLYDPSHFVSPEIWSFRKDAELSAAITVKLYVAKYAYSDIVLCRIMPLGGVVVIALHSTQQTGVRFLAAAVSLLQL